jgi:hypothetical protein
MNLRADPIMALDLNPCADEMSKTALIMRKEREVNLHDRHGLALVLKSNSRKTHHNGKKNTRKK